MARILVIRGGAIGDFILTLPAIRLLKTQLPDAHVEILGYESVAQLAKVAGLADATRSIEYGPLSAYFVPDAELDTGLRDYFSSFQLVVSYLHDQDGHFRANLERSEVKTLLEGKPQMDESGKMPAAAQLAKPLEQIALYLEEPYVTLDFESASAGESLIAIHPGSGSPRKNWGYERWAAVARRLHAADNSLRFLIVSGEAEMETISDLLELFQKAGLPFEHAEHLGLPEVARRIAACRLFLGHDSGISHLAGACGVPSVILFGPTDPKIWAPQNPQVHIISAPEKQLYRIDPASVASKALELLKR